MLGHSSNAKNAMIIDAMTARDIDEIARIATASFVAAGLSAPERALQLQEELVRPWATTWVARGEGARPVAFVLLWRVADEVHVLDVATAPSVRRQGYARKLMLHVIDRARADGGRLVLLEVRRTNDAAIALYHQLGFAQTGVREKYYSDGEDAVEMALTLDAGG